MTRAAALTGLFTVGASSLVFEVAASREAATYLGATATANSVLLGAFLAGIGLGGCAASLQARDQGRLLRRCGWLLAAAALLAAASAPELTWLDQNGPSDPIARGLLLGLLVLPVGVAVGFAYPALTIAHAPAGALGASVASTYAADTLGAAAGALAAGFLIVPGLGLRVAGILAGAGLGAIALLLLGRRSMAPAETQAQLPSSVKIETPAHVRLVLGLFFVTGCAALMLEVAWIRLFTLVIGTSLYSFTITVAAFLAALGLGSRLMRKRADVIRDPAAALGRIMILTGSLGAALLLLAPVWERTYLAVHQAAGGVFLFQMALFVLALASILLPAGLMGAGFSLGAVLIESGAAAATGGVAHLYGLNTLGGVLGALISGLFLLPAVGVRGIILIAAGIYLGAGLLLIARLARSAGRRATAVMAAAACGLLIAVGFLREPGFFYAPYYHGLRQGAFEKFARARAGERVLYRRFGRYGLVTVSEDDSYRYLRHDGRTEASTAGSDMSTQLLLAHVPMLMHPNPARVLNIGLGAGFTLGAIERHPETRTVVLAEVDPRIIEAARLHFTAVNGDALSDPRLAIHVGDARRLLADDSAQYDVIVSEPSNLWVSGVSGLFTREFFGVAGRRLAPGGILALWVPRYEMRARDIQIISATLLAEFPNVSAFENGPADLMFLASKTPFLPSLARIREGLEVAGIRRDFGRALAGFNLTPGNLRALFGQVAANVAAMPPAIPRDTPLNTDDRPVLEFHTAWTAVTRQRPGASGSN